MKTKLSPPADPTVYLPMYGQPVQFDTVQRRERAGERWGSVYGPCRSQCCRNRAADIDGYCGHHND